MKATNMDLGLDRSTVDALSWRLASELYRRQPDQSTLNRGHPGGGLYDCLMIFGSNGSGSIMLNRVGTILGHSRFDGRGDGDWRATTWEEYMRADPRRFLLALEDAAGLRPAGQTPPSSPATLVYRVLAVLTALASKSMRPYSVEQAYIDSSGDDGGPNDAIEAFPVAAEELRRAREAADLLTEPGFRYWIVWQHHDPCASSTGTAGKSGRPRQRLRYGYRRSTPIPGTQSRRPPCGFSSGSNRESQALPSVVLRHQGPPPGWMSTTGTGATQSSR